MFSGFQPLANRSEPHSQAPDCSATAAHSGDAVRVADELETILADGRLSPTRPLRRSVAQSKNPHTNRCHSSRPAAHGRNIPQLRTSYLSSGTHRQTGSMTVARANRERAGAASSSSLSHSLSRRTAKAADANQGSNRSHSERGR